MLDAKQTPPPMAFVSDYEGQADMLVNAFCVTEFLANVAPAMEPSHGLIGLSEDGCAGLGLILEALKNTISAALVLSGGANHD